MIVRLVSKLRTLKLTISFVKYDLTSEIFGHVPESKLPLFWLTQADI